jgi:hypothetical protein
VDLALGQNRHYHAVQEAHLWPKQLLPPPLVVLLLLLGKLLDVFLLDGCVLTDDAVALAVLDLFG